MINSPSVWYGLAGRAIRNELLAWKGNLKTVCREVNAQSRFTSTEAPWIRQLAWLSYALNGAGLHPKLALPAHLAGAVSDLIAEEMQQRYKTGAKLTNEFLKQNYKGVLNDYINLIDDIERSFFTHPLTSETALSIQRKLRDIALSPAAAWIREDSVDTKDGKFNEQKATEHLRKIVYFSGVLPTEPDVLKKDFVERGFAAIYDNIYAVVMRSNLVPKEQRLPGAVYQRYQGEPPIGRSGQLEEICIKSGLHVAIEGVRHCDLSFKAVQIASRDDALIILNELWQMDVELEPAKALVKVHVPYGWRLIDIKHVHLRQRKSPRVLRAQTTASVPEIHLALDSGFREYTRNPFRRAA